MSLSGDASFLTVSGGQLAGLAVMTVSAAPLGWALAELVRRWRPGGELAARPEALAGPEVAGAVPAAVGA